MADRTAEPDSVLGDFTATPRLVAVSLPALGIGMVGAYIAKALLALIAIFTNLFFFLRRRERIMRVQVAFPSGFGRSRTRSSAS